MECYEPLWYLVLKSAGVVFGIGLASIALGAVISACVVLLVPELVKLSGGTPAPKSDRSTKDDDEAFLQSPTVFGYEVDIDACRALINGAKAWLMARTLKLWAFLPAPLRDSLSGAWRRLAKAIGKRRSPETADTPDTPRESG